MVLLSYYAFSNKVLKIRQYINSLYIIINFPLTFTGSCIVIYSYNKSPRDALSLNFIWKGKELYMFRRDLLSIIRSLNTVFTATGICHTSYVASLLTKFILTSLSDRQHNQYDKYLLLCIQYQDS